MFVREAFLFSFLTPFGSCLSVTKMVSIFRVNWYLSAFVSNTCYRLR